MNPLSGVPHHPPHPPRAATDPGIVRFFVDDLDGGEDESRGVVVDGSTGADDVNAAPDYRVASQGFIGGVPPLSSLAGLPSYEEAAVSGHQGSPRPGLHDGRRSSSHDDLHPILRHRPHSSPHQGPRSSLHGESHTNPYHGPHPSLHDRPPPAENVRDGDVHIQSTVPRRTEEGGEES
ncbi:hypothetical protein M405DRAFT_179992 [Rhizopogon salebrosus TDB-379]|nr:hypothetical protein M405DRAFT_179992 [Rhizopogon salebrosus TDB-379]